MSKDKKKTAPEAAEETMAEQPEVKAEAEQTAASGQETPETEEKQPENKEEAKEEQKPEEKAPAEEKKSGDYAALNDRYLRLCAEYDNFRRRSQKEKDARKKDSEKLEELAQENAELNDKYLRLCAEYDNFRRRSQKEKDGIFGDTKASTVTAFLPVYDNLERALKQGTEDEAYRKGVEMIMTQFCTTLEKLGVTPIECLGEKFDPALHNAVMHVEDEEKGENEIVEVFQKGFMLGDKVIRFAMVKVAN